MSQSDTRIEPTEPLRIAQKYPGPIQQSLFSYY